MPKSFKLTPPKPFIPKEYDEQVSVFEYAAIAAKQDWRWSMLFSTLNGVRLPIGLARKMKRAGNKAGVPDLILPVSNGAFTGLFIELKRIKGGVVSNDQSWWRNRLNEQGFLAVVAKGAKEAIEQITRYLG